MFLTSFLIQVKAVEEKNSSNILIFLFLLLLVFFDYEEDDVHGGDIREIVELMKHGSDNGDVMKLNERIKPVTTNFNQQV